MKYLLETKRCRLREMLPSDAPYVYELNLHPDIFKFTTDPPFKNIEATKDFIKKYAAYYKMGIGRWTIELKEGNKYLGWCGLKYIPKENEVDIGYRLLPQYWGNGYAVETANACCHFGMQELGIKRIVARIHKQNFRSIRVAEKMKMIYEKDLDYDGVPWMNFVYPSSTNSKITTKIMTPPELNSYLMFM